MEMLRNILNYVLKYYLQKTVSVFRQKRKHDIKENCADSQRKHDFPERIFWMICAGELTT